MFKTFLLHSSGRCPFLLLFIFVFSSLLITGCSDKNKPQYNVVFFLVDTLRADTFTPEVMPNMYALSKKGTYFNAAFVQAPWTAPSIASIFTGLYPSVHGVVSHKMLGAKKSMSILPEEFETLAEIFHKSGYQTSAFQSNPWLLSKFGYAQGFETYKLFPMKGSTAELHKNALKWLQKKSNTKPFFLYLHYMDVHGPYTPPKDFAERFSSKYPSRLLTQNEFDKLSYLAEGKPFEDKKARNLKTYKMGYDGGAAYVDREIQSFIDLYKKEFPNEKTIFVFTADHGEAFFEHGFPSHGHTLYDYEIHVPLFFISENTVLPNNIINSQIELIDLYKTLADLCGLDLPGYRVSGKSQVKAIKQGIQPDPDRVILSQLDIYGPPRKCIRHPYFKYISVQNINNKQGPPAEYIFDLRKDPEEKKNILTQREALAASVRALINEKEEKINPGSKSGPEVIKLKEEKIDPATLEKLKTLGYIK